MREDPGDPDSGPTRRVRVRVRDEIGRLRAATIITSATILVIALTLGAAWIGAANDRIGDCRDEIARGYILDGYPMEEAMFLANVDSHEMC